MWILFRYVYYLKMYRYETHEEAGLAVQYVSKSKLDERIIRVDWDPGYQKGRQIGRGKGGQQKRDNFRMRDDDERPKKKFHSNY